MLAPLYEPFAFHIPPRLRVRLLLPLSVVSSRSGQDGNAPTPGLACFFLILDFRSLLNGSSSFAKGRLDGLLSCHVIGAKIKQTDAFVMVWIYAVQLDSSRWHGHRHL